MKGVLLAAIAAISLMGADCAERPADYHNVFEEGGLYTGCNYWASNAGLYMWRRWEPETVKRDIDLLAASGVNMMRVFPLWSDFQPLTRTMRGKGVSDDFFQNGGPLQNEAGVDEEMMRRFRYMCDVAEKNGMKLVVGLVSGFMSGRLFVPPALEQKNCLEDPEAMKWEVRFVRYFVSRMKDHRAIAAWDLGNECNNLGERTDAAHFWMWLHTISSAIRLEDATRPVVSGMHSMSTDAHATMNLRDQGELMDEMTTHPYPVFTPGCCREPFDTMRNELHPSAESLLYAGITGRHCFIEEVGDVGRGTSSAVRSARNMRAGMFSAWANGLGAYLWWCAFDQGHLRFPPYDWYAIERELGLFHADGTPKPVAAAMKEFRSFLDGLPFKALPARRVDAVCLMSGREGAWLQAFGAFLLSRQAGFDVSYSDAERPLPDAKFYIMPSGNSDFTYTGSAWRRVLDKVENGGATLLFSKGGDMRISDFERITGCELDTFYRKDHPVEFAMADAPGRKIRGRDSAETGLIVKKAKVIAAMADGTPVVTVNRLGKGKVVYVNFAIELNAINSGSCFSGSDISPHYLVYRAAAQEAGVRRLVERADVPHVGITEHWCEKAGKTVVVAVNYEPADVKCPFSLSSGKIGRVFRGDVKDGAMSIAGNDACVFEVE